MNVPYLVDTSVIGRTILQGDPDFLSAQSALNTLTERQDNLCIAAQNLIEFRSMATRPAGPPSNGLGLSSIQADSELARIRSVFNFLPDTASIYEEWERLVSTYGIVGRQVYDARLVAIMRVYGITHILTLNAQHFRRFHGITVVQPVEVQP